jgi:hypothetical protein
VYALGSVTAFTSASEKIWRTSVRPPVGWPLRVRIDAPAGSIERASVAPVAASGATLPASRMSEIAVLPSVPLVNAARSDGFTSVAPVALRTR